MISRGKLLIIFSIYFVFCTFLVGYEKAVLSDEIKQVREFDKAFDFACGNAAEALKNHIYEDNIIGIVKNAFAYSMASYLLKPEMEAIMAEGQEIEEIVVLVNGVITEETELKAVKDSDLLELHISYNDICINSFGRRKYISRHFSQTVR